MSVQSPALPLRICSCPCPAFAFLFSAFAPQSLAARYSAFADHIVAGAPPLRSLQCLRLAYHPMQLVSLALLIDAPPFQCCSYRFYAFAYQFFASLCRCHTMPLASSRCFAFASLLYASLRHCHALPRTAIASQILSGRSSTIPLRQSTSSHVYVPLPEFLH